MADFPEIIYPQVFPSRKTYEVGQFGTVTFCNTEEFIIDIFKKLENTVDEDTSTSSSAVKSTAKEYIRDSRDSLINYLNTIEGGLTDYIITGIMYGDGFYEESGYRRFGSIQFGVSLVKKEHFQDWISTAVSYNPSITDSWYSSGGIFSSLGMTAQTSYPLKNDGTIEGFLLTKSTYDSNWRREDYTDTIRQVSQGVTMKTRSMYYSYPRSAYYMAFYGSQINTSGGTPETNPSGTDTSTSGKYPSGEMGGLGTFDDHTDLSDISSKPSLNISDLGFFSIWNPSGAQLRSLADYVWNDPLNVSQWPQIFQSGILKPLDYIMSLSLFPVSAQQLNLSQRTFCMGGIVFDGRISALGKNIVMNQVTEQIIDVDMGTISLKEYFGSFLDYAPYSQVSLYLPYYQMVQLSMNELQNADSINIRYRINLLDGSTSIKVHIDRQTSAAQNGSIPLKHVMYEFFTNLKTEIPLTSGANTEQMKMLATVLTGAAAVVAAPIAGAGASALAGAAEGAATLGGFEGAAMGASMGNSAVGQAVSGAIKTGASAANRAVNSLPSGGGIQRGNIGGMNSGLLSERKPFLIITRPIQVLPLNYQNLEGYCSSIYTTLTAIGEGFVRCESVELNGVNGTASEKDAILEALKGGVYI